MDKIEKNIAKNKEKSEKEIKKREYNNKNVDINIL